MSWTIDFYYSIQTEGHIASVDTPGFCCVIIYITEDALDKRIY